MTGSDPDRDPGTLPELLY